MDKLTPKQEEVIRLMAKGLTNGQIAEHMGISLAGAKWHVGEVLSKYGVNSREQAVRMWNQEQTIGARIGRMAAAIPFPKLVGGGVAVAGIAALAVITLIISVGREEAGTGVDPRRERGEPVPIGEVTVVFPQYYANTTVRQVTVASGLGIRPTMHDMWASFDAAGQVAAVGYRTYDETGDIRHISFTMPGKTITTIDPETGECSTSEDSTPASDLTHTFLPPYIDEQALATGDWERLDGDPEHMWEVTGTWLADPHEAAAERIEPGSGETAAWQQQDGSFLSTLLVDKATGLAVAQGTAMPRDDGRTAGGGSRLLLVEIFTRERGETIIDQWRTELCD